MSIYRRIHKWMDICSSSKTAFEEQKIVRLNASGNLQGSSADRHNWSKTTSQLQHCLRLQNVILHSAILTSEFLNYPRDMSAFYISLQTTNVQQAWLPQQGQLLKTLAAASILWFASGTGSNRLCNTAQTMVVPFEAKCPSLTHFAPCYLKFNNASLQSTQLFRMSKSQDLEGYFLWPFFPSSYTWDMSTLHKSQQSMHP